MCVYVSTGVRYYMRGVDSDGHAANSVETEQIVVYQDARTSFVQVQICVLKYRQTDRQTDNLFSYRFYLYTYARIF